MNSIKKALIKRVEGVGPKPSKIMLIGEAPGAHEEEKGVPFVGPSGKLLDDCLRMAGIKRNECYITNVVKVRPPNNKLDRLPEIGYTVEDFYSELYDEVLSVNPNIIVCVGGTALKAITGMVGIEKLRGSLYGVMIKGKPFKVISIVHPRYMMKVHELKYISVFDLKKAKREAEFKELKRTKRVELYNLPYGEIVRHLKGILNRLDERKTYISIDLETYKKKPIIRCLAIATNIHRALCIPFVIAYKPVWSKEEEVELWRMISRILLHPNARVIGQNFSFEMTHLAKITGGKLIPYMDTMRAHALVYPEFRHGLDFLASIYTDMPYFKDDGKVSDEGKVNFEQLMSYNCKDVMATLECAVKLEAELKEIGMWEFYCEYDLPLQMALWDMQMRGVKINIEKLKEFRTKIDNEIAELQKKLNEMVGYNLNVKSHKQMCHFLYEQLGLPKKYKMRKDKRGNQTRTITSDEEALIELNRKFPHIESLKVALEIRRRRTLQSTFLDMKLSEDGRIRTSYGLTETGRLSSRKDQFGVGANLQNIPKRKGVWIREIFIPDNGKVIVKADLSQAEARVVAWMSRDENYKGLFRSGKDVHKLYASLLFNVPYDKVTKEQRAIAKNLRHGKNYNMGPLQLAKELGVEVRKARELMEEDDKLFPNIKSVFYAEVQAQLMKNRTLITPFGRKRTFTNRWGDALFREAYAYIPQSTVADIINHGIVELFYKLPKGADLLMQVHDEIVLQCYPHQVEEVARLIKQHVERPLVIGGDELIIPVDIEVGSNWANCKELDEWLKEYKEGGEVINA